MGVEGIPAEKVTAVVCLLTGACLTAYSLWLLVRSLVRPPVGTARRTLLLDRTWLCGMALVGCLPTLFAGFVMLFRFISMDMDASYSDYAEAVADGAVRRGWIPDFVPASATDIRESHNLDTNDAWSTFRFEPADKDKMVAVLTPIAPEDAEFSWTRRRLWWPEDLTRGERHSSEKYDFYKYLDHYGEAVFIAVDRQEARAWYWWD